nr:MAG TPA: hypothetical protein [Caudoviricetes sp.]
MDSYREGKLFKTQVESTRVRIPERLHLLAQRTEHSAEILD